MEASVDAPKKASRPAYRPMWEQAERELRATRALSHNIEEKAVEYAHKLATAESDLLTQNIAKHRWATVAIIEALVLILLALW